MIDAVLFVCVCLIVFYILKNKTPNNFPPGPDSLPIFGNLHQIPKGLIYPTVEEWSKKYGPIIGLNMFNQLLVIVTGVDNVLAALRKEEFQDRPDTFLLRARSFGKLLGIFFSSGNQWASSRKFAMKHLRTQGKNEQENIIADEINQLMDTIKDQSTIQANGVFGISAVNVIWKIIANKRIDINDERSLNFLHNLHGLFRRGNPSGGSILNVLPFLSYFSTKHKLNMKALNETYDYIRETIHEHREVLDPNNPMDLIDLYLVEMDKNKQNPNSLFTEEDLIMIASDLFGAGAESTSHSVEFLLIYMVLYPEAQDKMQNELDRVLGRGRKPVLEDKTQLHYTMAVLNEVERLNSIAPTNVPHVCTKDTTFGGYFIPKGTIISMNLRSLGYDPKYWTKPEEFNPSRFLNADGVYNKPSHCPTFGLGPRTCVGEFLARNSIFIFATTFFEKFSISLPPGDPEPSTTPLPGFTTAPQPFRISISSRY